MYSNLGGNLSYVKNSNNLTHNCYCTVEDVIIVQAVHREHRKLTTGCHRQMFVWTLSLSSLLCMLIIIWSTAEDMLMNSYVNKWVSHYAICAVARTGHCSTRPYHNAMVLRGRKVFGIEIDPGDVKGTKLKVLKYPHPKVRHLMYAVVMSACNTEDCIHFLQVTQRE